MSAEAVAIVGAAVGLLAVLVPLILTLHGRVAEVAAVRGEWLRCAATCTPWPSE